MIIEVKAVLLGAQQARSMDMFKMMVIIVKGESGVERKYVTQRKNWCATQKQQETCKVLRHEHLVSREICLSAFANRLIVIKVD